MKYDYHEPLLANQNQRMETGREQSGTKRLTHLNIQTNFTFLIHQKELFSPPILICKQ